MIGAGDHVTCTLQNENLAFAGVGKITVDKNTVPAGNPTSFAFTTAGGPNTIDDAFGLSHASTPHVTHSLAPGTYTITEAKPAGWDLTAACTGGPFPGGGGPYTSGAPILVSAGDEITCTFTNTLRSAAAGAFCPGPSTTKVLAARFPGYAGMDLVVRVDLGESIQNAVDAAADHNGDGLILVGVLGNALNRPGGHTTQRVLIDRVFPAPFGLVGCSVTLHDPDPAAGLPIGRITPGTAPAVFVMGLYAEDGGGRGWLVEGDGRALYSVNAARNDTGLRIVGNDNTVELGEFRANRNRGIAVVGNGNRLIGVRVIGNGSHGVEVAGDDNQVLRSRLGELGRGNGGDGAKVTGGGNLLERNRVFANAGDGIEVAGGTAAMPNVIRRNVIGDYAKGNGGFGILVFNDTGNGTPDPIEIDTNTVHANGHGGIFVAATATGHELGGNASGGRTSQDNLGCEFEVSAGNFDAARNVANRVRVGGVAGAPFPMACLGSP